MSGKPINSATPTRSTLRLTTAMRSMRQCSALRSIISSISFSRSAAMANSSSANPRTFVKVPCVRSRR